MKFLLIVFLMVLIKANNELYTRFLINEGDLWVDKGRYLEALDNYDSAFLASNSPYIKLDAQIKKANVLLLYLLKPKDAYNTLINAYNKYPHLPNSEYALFYSAMILKDIDPSKARNIFKKYIDKYPKGKFRFQASFFYKKLLNTKKNASKSVVKTHFKRPIIRVLLLKKPSVLLKGQMILNSKKYLDLKCKIVAYNVCCNDVCGKDLYIKSLKKVYIVNKKRGYLGDFKLVYKNGQIYLINYIDIEKYLYGVITSESLNSWDMEALKSQAVASRTFVLYQTKVRKNWLYDVRDDTFDQVYKGLNGVTKKSKLAANLTKGEVLTYKNKIILSQFCANVGWRSSSSKEIFNVDFPYLYSHIDKFSVLMPRGSWIKKVSLKNLEKNFKKMGINLGKIYNIVPYEKVRSGRVTKIKIFSDNGEKIFKTYTSLRRAAGLYDILLKDIEKKGNYFIFKGGGFGHGVGYSQWGAEAMAKKGFNYKDILKFYYKDVEITKFW